MKLVLYFLFLFSFAFADDVLDLTDSNFKDEVKDKDIILVEFFAPWCGHCKRLAPEYESAATKLKNNDPPVPLAKVDCVGEGKDTCSKYGVSGYPTLKIFRGGEISQDYDGPRDSAGIVSYMKNHAGPSSVQLKDVQHLETKLEKADDLVIVGYFNSESDLYKHFLKAADQKRSDFSFAHSLSSDINKHFGHEDVVVLHRPKHLHAKFEDPKEVLDNSDASTIDIKNFIDEKQFGLVGQLKQNNEAGFPKPLVVAYFNLDWKRDLKGSRYYRNRVARVAKKFTEINFAVAAKNDFSHKMSDWGFDTSSGVNVVAHNSKGQVFKMEPVFAVDALENFVTEFKDDKLKPYIKSEPVPEDNNGPVKVLVGENFDEIVNDPSKDVLIEFYAPWCGHCKSLEPKYNELGEKLRDAGVEDIVIAKMDATANDVPPNYQVQGFPTLYWAAMGNKDSPKKYEGGRDVSDFIDFLKREATNPFEISEKKSKKKKKKEL